MDKGHWRQTETLSFCILGEQSYYLLFDPAVQSGGFMYFYRVLFVGLLGGGLILFM